MATKRMLVDATHPEETRIIVTNGNRLEEFDFESASRKQLRGNIYLAKITRVEPSLQAAFVEYGGNRHGFLAFSEIHPDYYQIPVADKESLLEAEKNTSDEVISEKAGDSSDDSEAENSQNDEENTNLDENDDSQESEDEDNSDDNAKQDLESQGIEQIGGIDPLDDEPEPAKTHTKRYKIQEVIKRRQVILVQVVKEERGNKGAALTTHLSLAGRYSVLMPNTARGGGISRKITSAADRKRLKEVASELEVPTGMGVILRTAGASRTKAEIKRDFEYLMRLWENVRNLTLQTTAPSLVYEEGSLIKRTIRDLYSKEIDELFVAGVEAHKEAKEFMHMIMPTHAKKVKLYKAEQPIFSKYNMETQLDSMFSPQVTLPSGGYLVINPTEALVSIDVNSGRATKERNIEATALQTNLEAAEEVARQLRLRDMAGLVVIDFIDMLEKRSIRSVERKLKDALRHDRARIQVGRISHFGLMEMSRQRMRFGVLESSTNTCPTCNGAGIVRSVESMALMVMRAIEDHIQRKPDHSINVLMPADTALFLLNTKREAFIALETKYNISITISSDESLIGAGFQIEKGEKRKNITAPTHVSVDSAQMEELAESDTAEQSDDDVKEKSPQNRRRRNNKNHSKNNVKNENSLENENSTEDKQSIENKDSLNSETGETVDGEEEPKKRRRRGRRGGRRNRRPNIDENVSADENQKDSSSNQEKTKGEEAVTKEAVTKEAVTKEASVKDMVSSDKSPAKKPKSKARPVRKKKTDTEVASNTDTSPAPKAKKAKAKKSDTKTTDKNNAVEKEEPAKPAKIKKETLPDGKIVVTSSKADEKVKKPTKKGGWWQRNIFG